MLQHSWTYSRMKVARVSKIRSVDSTRTAINIGLKCLEMMILNICSVFSARIFLRVLSGPYT